MAEGLQKFFILITKSSIAQRVFAYLLLAIGILTFTFIGDYFKTTIPYPIIFKIIGIVFLWFGYALNKKLNENENINKIKTEIQAIGEQINIVFTDCEIIQNNILKEKENNSNQNNITISEIEQKIQYWESLYNSRNHKNPSFLIFNSINNGITEKFISRGIPLDYEQILLILENKKETILYIDKKDRKRYYFDLEFLYKKPTKILSL